jgi:type II secretory pathway component PulJ
MDGTGRHPHGSISSGSGLLEAVVALAIVGMAILVATNALQSHAMLLQRSAVREELLHAAEDVLEQLRGGVLPLDGRTAEASSATVPGGARTVVSVEPLDIEGLYRVTVTARASLPGEPLAVELTTMVWRP